jgi:cell division protein FtsA
MANQPSYSDLLVALDIGTTKVSVLVAQRIAENGLSIVGIGKAPAFGVSRGIVTDIAQAVDSIKLAVKEAELMAGCKIESAVVGTAGSHIRSLTSQGMIPIKNNLIRAHDISAVLAAARAIVLPEGQQILHVLPQYYTIDNTHRVADPEGMVGIRLEAQVYIVTAAIASVQNLIRCCQTAGIAVTDLMLEPIASADSVLSKDEKELGIGVLDIGGGTSDFAIYQQGTLRHTKIFPIAGNHITHDIALCLRTTLKDAERVKQQYGTTLRNYFTADEQIEVEMVHGEELKTVTPDEITRIIEPRVAELLMMVQKDIEQNNLEHLMPAGIVLTGGGAQLQGIQETTTIALKFPTRVGSPHVPPMFKEVLGNPIHATGYGLLLHALKKSKGSTVYSLSGPVMTRLYSRMKSWATDFF